MGRTAFVDESMRRDYLLCAVVVDQARLGHIRREVTRARGSYGMIHMTSRNDAERLAYARMLAGLDVTGLLFATRSKGARAARDLLLGEMVPRLVAAGVTDLVIESCQEDAEDRRILRRLLGSAPKLAYRHGGKSDLLLSLPDILAWAHGRGGRYRAAVKPVTIDHGRFGTG